MKPWTRWKDWVTGFAGLWLLVSPWAFQLTAETTLMWTSVVLGALMMVASVWALARPSAHIAEWSNIVLGALLFIAPWVIAFTAETTAAWNAWIVGAIVFVLAIWALPEAREAYNDEHSPHIKTRAN